MTVGGFLARWELATRPIHPESRSAMQRRWAELPTAVQTDNQLLGRSAIGCEGTHGVFPKCNLTCSPCYHSADANKVGIDGSHTLAQVERQMAFAREVRGPRAHAQLIGGEVSLLPADDHAAALAIMRRYGREPMSMTHGDFDADYLRDVVLDARGKPRFDRVSFAAHFDSLMRGRRGLVRPRGEAELNPFRAQFAQMFVDLKRDHGVRSYLAHNMTVTPSNLPEVAETVRAVLGMPFDMMSFQPAAFIGDDRRWKEDFSAVSIDTVWEQVETGVGQRLPWQATQFGHPSCNRYTTGVLVDGRFVVALDPDDPRDLAARDTLLAHVGGMVFGGTAWPVLAVKITRSLLRHPGDAGVAVGQIARIIRRAGGLRAVMGAVVRRRVSFRTFVVHSFMDAEQVAPAWALLEDGKMSDDAAVRETQIRLQSCSYAMSHPADGRLVPACVQHSILDPGETRQLRTLLPLTAAPSGNRPQGLTSVRRTGSPAAGRPSPSRRR
ncbi:MAG: hypothetical protein AB7K08_14395 [Microbacteriaceae bacterium]